MKALQPYTTENEAEKQALHRSLRENDRRRYAVVEAHKVGYGGAEHISRLFACEPKTIRVGGAELAELPDSPSERV